MTLMLTMPTWLFALTVVVSGAAGYASCYFGVVKIGTALMRRPKPGGAEMPNRRTPWVPIIMLVASAMVIALGAMYWLENRAQSAAERERAAEQAAYDRCITQWGDDLVATINTRNDYRRNYDTALERRDDATAHVFNVGLRIVTGDRLPENALQVALERARRADERVQTAKDRLDSTQVAYEPPTLACADERK